MIKKEDLSRTVFVKNISFDTTQTTFQERMKQYGPYKFCLICMDKMLGRSKGTGFVKFEERADAARCVESLQAGELTLDGKVGIFAIFPRLSEFILDPSECRVSR